MIWRVEQVAPLHVAAVAAPLAGVAREKVERAMWRVAKGLVEIAFADRDNFGTAVALALMLLLRLAPFWHRFAPHCVFEFHLLLPCEAHHRQRSVELRADERTSGYIADGRRLDRRLLLRPVVRAFLPVIGPSRLR